MRASPLLALFVGCSDYELEPKPDEPDGADEECALTADAGTAAVNDDCVVEPLVGTFNPVVEWRWESNELFPGYDDLMSTPAVGNLTDDNGDGRIDGDDIPDVVFTSFASGGYTTSGTLTAISGDGSGTWWSVASAGGYTPHASGSPAIGDLDGDGSPEVCTAGTEIGVLCFTARGELKWAGGAEVYGYGSPAMADVDGDGASEVVWGRSLLDTDGTLLWQGGGGAGWFLSFAVDLDGDGVLEIVTGNTVYNADGTQRWTDGTPDGPGAVGDFDLDGTPEVVHVYPPYVYLTDADGTPLWAAEIPGGGGGAPTVADFDADGYPEVGVAGAYAYAVIDTDGLVLWSATVQDYSSSVTGSSVFDFEGDGAADVVYADEVTLWVYDGATGAVKFRMDDHASGTLLEYPLIVDVDNDGATEIVLASNDYAFDGWNGITVIGDADGSWRPSRPVWNQFAYHITNVEDDGSIPAVQSPNWERYNTFRAGGTTLGLTSELADLEPGPPDLCLLECATGSVQLTVGVRNTGTADSLPFTAAIFTSSGARLVVETLQVPSGASVELTPLTVERADWDGSLYLRLDDEDAVEECDETDNVLDLGGWPCR